MGRVDAERRLSAQRQPKRGKRESIDEKHVVGALLRAQKKTVAVYEDITCGQLAERLQSASTEEFAAGYICNSETAIRTLLMNCHNHEKLANVVADPISLTDELAASVREQSGSDFGLALHAPVVYGQNSLRG